MLGGLGGARPTGLDWLDPVLLALGGGAAAACGARARTLPAYAVAGLAVLLQPAVVPLLLGAGALVAALARRMRRGRVALGAVSGGMAWACAMGAPRDGPAEAVLLVLAAFGWLAWSARRHGGKRFRRRFDQVAVASGSVLLVAAGLGAAAVVSSRAHLDRGTELMRDGLEAARQGDTERAIDDLRRAGRALRRGEASLGALWARPAWLVPGVSQNTRALYELAGEVRVLARTGVIAAEDGPMDELRARAGVVDLAAVAATEEPITRVLEQLRRSRTVVDGVDERFLLPPVADRVDELRAELDDAIPSAELALEGVRVAPTLLGGEGPRTYLVLFTTPVEARAHLGFPGNFAEITFIDGRFAKSRFGRISELNLHPGPRSLGGPAEFIQRYGRFDPADEWRSLTFSPDLPTVAQVAAELYPQSGGRQVDGVVTVDPVALAALLRITGPVAVPGLPDLLTAKTAADFLLRGQYVDLPDNPERIDALETLSDRTFDQLTTADLPAPRDLRRIFGPVVEQGHLQVVAFDARASRFLDELGITGDLPPVEGDSLAVTTSNVAMNKIDLFLRRSLSYEVSWDRDTGEVQATATVTLANEAPTSGLPPYVIGNLVGENRPGEADLPDGWNNVFLTVYSPWVVEASSLDGEDLPLEVLPELGRNAISTVVELAPGQTRTITIELRGFLEDRRYVLDLAAQPLVEAERAEVRISAVGGPVLAGDGPVEIDGRTAEGAFDLVRDERITLR